MKLILWIIPIVLASSVAVQGLAGADPRKPPLPPPGPPFVKDPPSRSPSSTPAQQYEKGEADDRGKMEGFLGGGGGPDPESVGAPSKPAAAQPRTSPGNPLQEGFLIP